MKYILYLTHPVTIGIAVWLLLANLIYSKPTPSRCSDRWYSNSIGSQGACSHHGGVVWGNNGSYPLVYTVGALGAGWSVSKIKNRFRERKKTKDSKKKTEI